MLPRQSLIPVGLFAALLLIISLHALAASGQFPHRHGSPASGIGSLVLYGSTAVVLACLMIGLALAWWLVPWYAAVIAGGLSVLAAPVVLQQFPDTFVDGGGALLTFAAAAAVLALLLIWFASVGIPH
ncbi:MAG: hypothetical protein ACJ8FM_22875 [Xanthobacteraceae bacterium]|jgi:hypothetical protein